MRIYRVSPDFTALFLITRPSTILRQSQLRVAQVTGGAPAKLSKIGSVRKSIARVLTVHNQLSKSKVQRFLT